MYKIIKKKNYRKEEINLILFPTKAGKLPSSPPLAPIAPKQHEAKLSHHHIQCSMVWTILQNLFEPLCHF